MRLQSRVLLIISVVTVAMMVISVAVVWPMILNNYQRLEDREVTSRAQQLRSAVMHEVSSMDVQTVDWANWDETAAYLRGEDATYLSRNVLPAVFASLDIRFMGFYGREQSPVLLEQPGPSADLAQAGDAEREVMVEIISRLSQAHEEVLSGFVNMGSAVVLFSARAVHQTNGQGESPGYIFMARPVDAAFVGLIRGITQQDISLSPVMDTRLPKDDAVAVELLNNDQARGTIRFTDITGAPILEGTVTVDRAITRQAHVHLVRILWIMVFFGILMVVINYFALVRYVVQRIDRLRKEVSRIKDSGDLLGALGAEQPDEIGELIRDFNGMVGRLADAHRALNRARADAEAMNEARGRFMANMSHEIRTPMTAILGYSELLADNSRLDDQTRHYLKVIQDNSEMLLTLVNDILDLSRIEVGRLAVLPVPTDVAHLIADSVDFFRDRAAVKGVALVCEPLDHLPHETLVDPVRLRQVLLNLIGNAVKFTERGQVVVRATREDGHCIITVEDTGIGINPVELQNIFEPFWQADTEVHRRYTGVGLGLVISRQLIRLMGGDIVASSKPGHGSAFTVSLPLRESTPEAGSGGEAPVGTCRLQGHVLLAEDNDVNRLLLRTMLEKMGLAVTAVSNGEQVLEKLLGDQLPVDCVLMDMLMPVLDGLKATQRLRAAGFGKPVIALTASAMPEERALALEAGCTDFAGKPISQAELQALCERYIPQGDD